MGSLARHVAPGDTRAVAPGRARRYPAATGAAVSPLVLALLVALAPAHAKPRRDAEAAAAAPKKAERPPVDVFGRPGHGVTLAVGDVFSLNLRSRIQVRYQLRIPPADEAGDRTLDQLVNIGTLRLWISGHALTPKLTYMIQLALADRDFRDGARSPLYDAFLDWKAHRDIGVKAGQYFVPFDRLRTVREFALQMSDRPRPVQELTLDRDVGFHLYSDHFLGDRSPVAWRVGVFGGGGTNLSVGRVPGALAVARLELRPLGDLDDDSEGDLDRRLRPGLALGGAFAANVNTNRLRSTTGPTLGGVHTSLHAAADLVFKWRGFALQGEYLWKRADRDTVSSTDDDGAEVVEFTRSAQGWVVQASYVFAKPVELVGRVTQIFAFDGTDPKLVADLDARGNELGAGVNWYFNGHRGKLQATWLGLVPRDWDVGRAEHQVVVQADVTF